jgi:hypothetical protein
VIDEALQDLYTPVHRSTFRVMVDTTVARHPPPASGLRLQLALLRALQGTKASKSLLVLGLCGLFGWGDQLMIRSLPNERGKSFLLGPPSASPRQAVGLRPGTGARLSRGGHRRAGQGRQGGPHLHAQLLQGQSSVPGKRAGEKIAVAPVPVVCSNDWPRNLPRESARRSVVLTTRSIED